MLRIIDLRKEGHFIEQYTELRNRYLDLLLTDPVTIDETKQWINTKNVEVRCLIDDNELVGSVICYLHKGNEITIFVKYPGKGIGTKLLHIIEEVAKEKGLSGVYAWVLLNNIPGQTLFLRNGYILTGFIDKEYKGKMYKGAVFRKKL